MTEWEKFLRSISTPTIINNIQKVLGYALMHDRLDPNSREELSGRPS